MNYLVYPFKIMRLTQSYTDGNHAPHSNGNPKDRPLDEAGTGTGRDWFYCPCDEVKIVKLYGNANTGYHVWLEPTKKVVLANGKTDYVTIMAVHLDYDDYSKLKVGQKFKRGEKIFREGTSGNSTGNHIHFCVGLGRSSSNKKFWQINNKGVWVLITPKGSLKPENAFFVDGDITTIRNDKNLNFVQLKGSEDMSRGYFKSGDKNEGVLALKQMLILLNEMGIIKQGMDNNEDFGVGTKSAVKQVQKKAGITQDGFAGPETIKACRTLLKNAYADLNEKISKARTILE